MRIIRLELKKVFRPIPVIVCVMVLCLMCSRVPRRFLSVQKRLNTQDYPEQFTVYDGYSVDILFHDFLKETYGNTLTPQDTEDLTRRYTDLLNQVAAAAETDPVLLRTGMRFDRESASFYTPGAYLANRISEEDEIYHFSCINGQTRFPGTDHPCGFLPRFRNVLQQINAEGSYSAFSSSLLYPVDYLDLTKAFLISAWALLIPYGVGEVRSNTEALTAITKTGRRTYRFQVLAGVLLLTIFAVLGVAGSLLLQYSVGLFSHYAADATFALHEWWLPMNARSVTFGEFAVIRLIGSSVIGFSAGVLILLVSLSLSHAVTAIAASLPIFLTAVVLWFTGDSMSQLEFLYIRIGITVFAVIAFLVYFLILFRRQRKEL